MVIYARFDEARYFCWAPHDSQNEYAIFATVNDQTLTPDQIQKRYRIKQKGIDPRAIQHIKDIIERYETTYGKDSPAEVIMHYSTNGIEKPSWRWPKT